MTVKTYEEVLTESGTLCWKTVGTSMEPLIREGRDIVVIKKAQKPYEKNDVVLFKRPGMTGRGAYVLHRILKINPDGSYWIIGDHCWDGETVQVENILGVLTSIIRRGKNIALDSFRYRFYVHLWCDFYPERCFLLRYGSIPKRAFNRLIKKVRTVHTHKDRQA